MKKKTYEKPSLRIVELQHQTHLLQMSGQTGVNDYNNQEYFEE